MVMPDGDIQGYIDNPSTDLQSKTTFKFSVNSAMTTSELGRRLTFIHSQGHFGRWSSAAKLAVRLEANRCSFNHIRVPANLARNSFADKSLRYVRSRTVATGL